MTKFCLMKSCITVRSEYGGTELWRFGVLKNLIFALLVRYGPAHECAQNFSIFD